MPIPVAVRSKALVCNQLIAGITGLNPGSLDICVVCYSKDKKAKCRTIEIQKQVRMK